MTAAKCCFFCQSEDPNGLIQCQKCEIVYFCSEDHGRIHWPGLETSNIDEPCFPFRVSYNETQGHYLVATRDIQPGELVMKDRPFAEGPGSKSPPVCLQCSKDAPTYRCSKCGLPVCNEVCEEGPLHKNNECPLFAKAFDNSDDEYDNKEGHAKSSKLPKIENLHAPCPLYTCITPLRLLLREWNAEKNNTELGLCKRLNKLIDHGEERKSDQKSWILNHVLIVSFIQKVLGLTEETTGSKLFTETSIHRAIGLLRTNSVKLDSPVGYTTGTAIYPTFSFLNHNCVCNTRTRKYVCNGENRIKLEAILPIKKDEEITTRYTTPQLGTMRRQQLLQNQWYFSCQCKRCLDPYELGSLTNSVMCPICQKGAMVPKNPTKLISQWRCENCGDDKLTSPAHVMRLLLKVEADINQSDDVQKNEKQSPTNYIDSLQNKRECLEKILHENEGITLHPNHFLLTGVREKLIHTLIAQRSYTESEDEACNLLKYQVEMFKKVADVMGLVDLPRTFWDKTKSKMEKELNSRIESMKLHGNRTRAEAENKQEK